MYIRSMDLRMRRDRGFTLVELIAVLVLAGILSATIVPRFLDAGTFDAIAARDSLIAVIRSGQQASLGRSNVSVTIRSTGDEWVASAMAGASELRSVRFPDRSITLETGSAVASTLDCASGFDTPLASDFTLQFDNEGNLGSFTNGGIIEAMSPTFNGVRLCVDDNVTMSLCVSRAGYAHQGDCDD